MCSTGNRFKGKLQSVKNVLCKKKLYYGELFYLRTNLPSDFFLGKSPNVGREGREGMIAGHCRLTPQDFSHVPLQKIPAKMHCGAGGTAAVVTSHGVDSERVFSK